MLMFEDLKVGSHYIATDKDGRKHKATCGTIPNTNEKIVFCCYPMFTSNGERNDLVSYEEVTK